jgi:hypothetical protein
MGEWRYSSILLGNRYRCFTLGERRAVSTEEEDEETYLKKSVLQTANTNYYYY